MSQSALSADERLDWIRLARTSGVGPVTFFELLNRFGDAPTALDAVPRLAKRGGRIKANSMPSRDHIHLELDRYDALGACLICACEPDFPMALRTLDPPPPIISAIGPLKIEEQPACAIVGARNASAVGIKLAGDFARALGEHNVVTVSGLARGIDGAAHAASLETGTVAVIAGGLGRVYPPEHSDLQHAIAQQGLIISEAPPDYTAQARDFPKRNRLIAGLSAGTLVIEAAERSGSLITARLAGEMGREVMAVPGSPLDPRAKGTNKLLREGAALVETVEDVLAVLQGASQMHLQDPGSRPYDNEPVDTQALETEVDRIRDRIREKLGPVPVSRDELIRQLGVPAQIVMACLMELELAGQCQLTPGGLVFYVPE